MSIFGKIFGGSDASAGSTQQRRPRKTVSLQRMQDLASAGKTLPAELAAPAKAAGYSLTKRNLAGVRGEGIVLVDHSGSMYDEFEDGRVAQLLRRIFAAILQIDADGNVPMTAFDTRVWPTSTVTLDDYTTVIDDLWHPNQMGSTDLARALRSIRPQVEKSDLPTFLVVATDGNPNPGTERDVIREVCELAEYPVFIKFMALKPVPFLDKLDDLPDTERLLDNVDTKASTRSLDLLKCSDAEFMEALLDEWDSWFTKARAVGLITD